MDLGPFEDLGARAIRPDAPSGDPVRDDPEFETLQTEIRRLERADGGQPDWKMVLRQSDGILRTKSKDLLPACYLAFALFQEEGFSGLSTGLKILNDLIMDFWDSLYPEVKRVRGRLAAFEWLSERGAQAVRMRPRDGADAEVLAACVEKLGRLSELLEQKAEGGWGSLGNLRAALEEASAAAMREAPAPPSADQELAPPAGGPAPAAAPTVVAALSREIATEDEANRLLGDLREAAHRLGAFYRAAEPKNPIGYRLPRAMAWMHLRELPPHTDGMTRIPCFQPADLGLKLQEMSDRGQWAGVLEQGESRFAGAVLWLDLERFATRALEGLGSEFRAAADAIVLELSGLLHRLPGLERLTFANGVPLADATTLAWISERVSPSATGEDAAQSGKGIAGGGRLGEAADLEGLEQAAGEARNLIKNKQVAEAVRTMEAGAERAQSLSGRAQWKLELGRACLDAGYPETAQALLQELDQSLRGTTFEDWNPAFSFELAKTLLLSHQKILSSHRAPPAEELAQSRELFRRLCRLDVAAAIAMEGRH